MFSIIFFLYFCQDLSSLASICGEEIDAEEEPEANLQNFLITVVFF